MKPRSRQVLAYAAAPILIGAAFLVRNAILGDTGEPEPDLLLLAVAVAGALGGLGPAVVAAAVGLVEEIYYRTEPVRTFLVSRHRDRVELTVFLVSAIAIGVTFEILRRIRKKEAAVRRTLAMITRCNEAILRATTEEGLYADICKVIVDEGGHRMCWVGLAEHDARKTVRPVAHAGREDGYLETVDIVWADEARGRGPTGTALREGRIVVGGDLAIDPTLAPWRDESLRRGYRSVSSIPIVHEGRVLAVIVIYSGEVEAFGPSEVGFLERLSNDVAFGVNAIRQRAVRERQEVELREARARLAYVLEGSSDGFWDWDVLGGHVDFSPSTGSMLGYGPGELAPNASAWARLIHPDDAKGVRAALDAHLRGESGQFAIEHRALHKDGRWIWLLDRGKVVERGADGTPTRMAGTYTDVTERRRSQEALANSERQYRDLLDLSPSPTLLDRGGRIGFVNRAALELFGAERPEQLLGRSPFDLLHPDSHALVRDRTEKIEAEGSVGIGEMRVLRLDGTPREVEAAGALYRDAEGSAMQVILHDVTERRLAERALRESEARHRLLADNALDVVWTMSLDGRITYLSPAVEKLRGYTVAEAMRQPIEEIHPPGSAAVSLGYFQRLAADMGAGRPPQRFRGELEYRCRDGSTVWCEVMVLPVVGPDGAVTELLGVSRDLSERKRTEEALRSSEALLRTVTESSPDAILAKDRHGRWTFANDAALRTVGRSSEEVLGRSDEEILGNSAAARQTMAHDRKVMESGVPQGFEEKLPGPTGMRTLLSSKAPLRDAEGRVVGIVAVAKDVTEQRLMEQRLAVASRLAAMGTLVAGVAHEINNPMTGIMAGLGTATGDIRDHLAKLERGERPSREELVEQAEEVLEVLADADDAAARIARIVQDLAVFGAPNQQRTRRRAAEIVSGAMRWLSAHVHGAATVSFEDLGAPDVMASLGQLEQVLVNLVTNAARATCPGEKGAVAVRIGTGSAGTAFLEVEDRGIGIDPANVGRVFDPFFTTRPAGQGRGTGLGLAICHAIVADHGGAITVESELGKGSRFRVELPAAPGEA